MSQLNFEELTKGLTTKSEKIRVLGRKGVPTAEIARFLEIRYQHARNVLVDAGLQHGGMAEEMPTLETKMIPPLKNSASPLLASWEELDSQGRLRIPQMFLEQAKVSPGDRLFIKSTERGFEVFTIDGAMARLKELAIAPAQPGGSVVDEFIEERRLQVAADEAKWKRLEVEAEEAAKNG